MPLGFERLNERSQRPNVCINFIKPLDGPDRALSEDYLHRIAAQCFPVMKANHISVMTLAEHEHNNEFLGRNFNAGECIELVLKDKTGRWLGFKFVQMVMMHELAHCKQMNHSKYFWQVRNQYADEMYKLWARQYFGEGVWGRGRDLATGSFVMERDMAAGDVPEHLCGGTFRRRGRKRKRGGAAQSSDGTRPSYAERQQKRIQKKFGKHGDGNTLGENEFVRGALEQGHRHQGKPRVAGSKRGRELRAQAALARFEAAKTIKTDDSTKSDNSDVEWSDSETEDEDSTVLDGGFVKVCGEEDEEDGDARNEMQELQNISHETTATPKNKHNQPVRAPSTSSTESEESAARPAQQAPAKGASMLPDAHLTKKSQSVAEGDPTDSSPPTIKDQPRMQTAPTRVSTAAGACPICSLENDPSSLLCMACANVLRPKLVKGSWRCQSETCTGSTYLNAGDAGRCGICGSAKPAVRPAVSSTTAPISADVLRWD